MFGAGARNDRDFDQAVQRAIQATAWGTWGDETPFAQTWSGAQVTNESALQLLAVYGCVRFICEGVSTLPINVFRNRPDGAREEVNAPPWLDRPTVDLDRISWLTQILMSLLLAGNAYLRKVYIGGTLAELVPLDPKAVTVHREKGRKAYRVNGRAIDPFEILHIPGIMFPGADVGLSPVEAARQQIGSGMAVEEFAARFFGQGANLGGVIEDPGELNPERAKRMARGWARLHSGNAKAHLPGVLQGGARWVATGVTNEQAQFLATRQFGGATIASHMFLIDPTEFGFSGERNSNLTYQNLEQRNARKVQVTFLPWIIRLERAFSDLLAAPRYMKLNVKGLLRGDTKTRFDTYLVASQINTAAAAVGEPPVLTTAEMRELEDMEPYEGDVPKPVAAAAPTATEPAAAAQASLDEPRRLSVVRDREGFIVSLSEERVDVERTRKLDLVRDKTGNLVGLEEVSLHGTA